MSPFIAFGLFIMHNCDSLIDAPCNHDPTMIRLYSLVTQYHENHFGNQQDLIVALRETLKIQAKEYENLLELVKNESPMQTLHDAINSAQERNESLKETYEDDLAESEQVSKETEYMRAMAFVDRFKDERNCNGITKMNWLACFTEGKEKGLVKYKSAEVLHKRYGKFKKDKEAKKTTL